MDKEEERDWKETVFVNLVTDPDVRKYALESAKAMHGSDEPKLQLADLETARSYLRKCLTRMSVPELKATSDGSLALLWAKGTVGAAKYRVRGR